MFASIGSRRSIGAAFLSLVLLTTASAHAADSAVMIDNFSFAPGKLTVARGTKVVFTNRDDIPHTVTSARQPPSFKSAPLDTGDSFAFTFDKPGTFAYFCSLHPHMQGTIVVK